MLNNDLLLDEDAEPVMIKQLDLTHNMMSTTPSETNSADSTARSPPDDLVTPSMRIENIDPNMKVYDKEFWESFLMDGEAIILTAPIWKKKTFLTVKRQLILTDKPRLLVIDIQLNKITKEIQWTSPLIVELRNSKSFDLITTHRKYHYTDCEGNANRWKVAIDSLNSKLFQ